MRVDQDISLQYIAGFFDGEGCIIIGKRYGKTKLPIYTLMTCLVNTYRPLIEELGRRFGASLSTKARVYRSGNYGNVEYKNLRRTCFQWNAASEVAEKFLRDIYPHMIIKRAEAELAFEFREHIRRYKGVHSRNQGTWLASDLYQQIQIEREAMYQKMRALKRVDHDGMETNSVDSQNGQYRAKQEGLDTLPGVCNEQVSPAKAKVCSGLNRNVESAAEMTAPHLKIVGNKSI